MWNSLICQNGFLNLKHSYRYLQVSVVNCYIGDHFTRSFEQIRLFILANLPWDCLPFQSWATEPEQTAILANSFWFSKLKYLQLLIKKIKE